MASVQNHIVGKMVHRITAAAMGHTLGLRRDGPTVYAKSGPWRVELEGRTARLIHHGTKMLEWHYDLTNMSIPITGAWTGWGSVSDQTGVNAALWALGSKLRYSRDRKGGGPRINPFRVASGMSRLTNITPPVY